MLILSDTHLSDAAALPAAVLAAADKADHIVHAGDHSTLEIVSVLEQFAPVTAVHGNVELPDVYARLPRQATARIGSLTFGVVHDAGATSGRHLRLARELPDCDVRVYGHSHMPEMSHLEDGSWVINPGSPVQRRQAPFHSFAWLTIDAGVVNVELVNIDDAG